MALNDDLKHIVNSHNEWDPLEEVIVGNLEGGCDLSWEPGLEAVIPEEEIFLSREYFTSNAGRPKEEIFLGPALDELEVFINILTAEGIRVRRPEPFDHARPHASPEWNSPGGNCQADPRDVLIVIGQEILEATMCWRSRYFEVFAYRKLLKEYFRSGAKWSAAPKPQLTDDLFDSTYERGNGYVTTEFEPVFDAADITRCGKDLFVQRSQVTNEFGIEWLRRHLEPTYNVHMVEFEDDRAMHIDATFVPLCPGKVLVNPDRPIKSLPEIFNTGGWELLTAPRSTLPTDYPNYKSFRWLSMNMLSLDEKRIIVEKKEEPMIKALENWGFEPIPCSFRNNYRFGGSFHCATVDIRRRGGLQSYF